MKTTMLNLFFLAAFTLLISSCGKTYVCQCTGPDGTNTTTTGQVKAYSKKKAEKLCSATCSGGTSSAK